MVLQYALFRSGIIAAGGNFTPDDNFTNQVLAAFGIGALSGYGSHQVFIWLDKQVRKIFNPLSISEDKEPIPEVEVPNLKGKTQKEAEASLEEANLKLGKVRLFIYSYSAITVNITASQNNSVQ